MKNGQNLRENDQKLQPCKLDPSALLACRTTSPIHYSATWQPRMSNPGEAENAEFLKELAAYIYDTRFRPRGLLLSYIYATRSLVVN